MKARTRRSLSLATDAVLMIAAVVIVGITALRYFEARELRSSDVMQPYRVGDEFPELPGVDFGLRPATLVMYLRSTCNFCTASMPLYRQLAELSQKNRQFQMVAISFEEEAPFASYLREHSLSVDHAISVEANLVRQGPTPILLQVDRNRRVSRVWLGQLTVQEELTLKKTLGT